MRTRTRRLTGLTTLAIGATVVAGGLLTSPASAAETREILPGNPDCESLGYAFEAKFDATPEGDVDVEIPAEVLAVYPGLAIEITDAGNVEGVYTIDFAATQDGEPAFVISAVILKQSNEAAVYRYDPPVASDTDLNVSGIDPSNDLSHVSFCLNAPAAPTTTTTTVVDDTTTTTTVVEATTTTTIPEQVLGTTTIRQNTTTTAAQQVGAQQQAPAQVAGAQLARTGGGNGALAAVAFGLLMVGGGSILLADDWRHLLARQR